MLMPTRRAFLLSPMAWNCRPMLGRRSSSQLAPTQTAITNTGIVSSARPFAVEADPVLRIAA